MLALPVLTLLMFFGLARALTRRDERDRITFALFFLWLLLYFGRPTWGGLLNLLPMGSDLHLHRFIGGVHLAAILLIGIGLHALWGALRATGRKLTLSLRKGHDSEAGVSGRPEVSSVILTAALPLILIIIILLPTWGERVSYLNENEFFMARTQEAMKEKKASFDEMMGLLRNMQKEAPGRVFAGLPTTWGSKFTVGDVPLYALLSTEMTDNLGYLYHAMSLNADIQVYFDENNPTHYNLFNIAYVVAPIGKTFPDFVKPVKTIGDWAVYRVQTSGYFDLVRSDLAFYGPKEDFYRANLKWLRSDLPTLKQHPSIFFEKDKGDYKEWIDISKDFSPPGKENFKHVNAAQISSTRDSAQSSSAAVALKDTSYLLFKTTYHPYWRVLVDNVEKDALMLSPSYMGVRLEPGEHRINFQYRPPAYKTLLLIAGLATLVALFFLERRLVAYAARVVGPVES